jgi:hypothetical protein
MVIESNIYYWKKSLQNPEPIIDTFYSSDYLIITNKEFIQRVEKLRDLITTYCIASKKSTDFASEILNQIYEIIDSTYNIQYSEFVAFWKTLDVSFSLFQKLPNKMDILRELIEKYCQNRQKIYDQIGYSNVTLQALYDVSSSKRKSISGVERIIKIVKQEISNLTYTKNLEDIISYDNIYFLADKSNRDLFYSFCKKMGIKYYFGEYSQDKLPDIILRLNNHFL